MQQRAQPNCAMDREPNKSYWCAHTIVRSGELVKPLFELTADGFIATHTACQTLIHLTLAARDFQNPFRPTHPFPTNRHARWMIQTFPQ